MSNYYLQGINTRTHYTKVVEQHKEPSASLKKVEFAGLRPY